MLPDCPSRPDSLLRGRSKGLLQVYKANFPPTSLSDSERSMTLSVPVSGLKRDQLGDELGEEGGNDRRRSRGDPEGEATRKIKRQEKPVPERMRRSRETGP